MQQKPQRHQQPTVSTTVGNENVDQKQSKKNEKKKLVNNRGNKEKKRERE